MENLSEDSISEAKTIDFNSIAVDTTAEKHVYIENVSDRSLTYRVSLMYVLDSVDRVFDLSITSTPVKPGDSAIIRILFKPQIPGQSFTDYYIVDDTSGNTYKLTIKGKCYGPDVTLNKRKLTFRICRNVTEQRKEVISIINRSAVDTTYQWLLPLSGQGYFQISTGNCGLIRSFETITTTVTFTGTALGIYTAELVCLVLNQEPLFLHMVATVVLPGNPLFNIHDHIFEKNWKRKSRSAHLMENSLDHLTYIPSASVFERYLDFGMGSVTNVTMNISQTLCVTNHEQEEGYIQWGSDPDNVFLIDPIASVIPPNESRLFTVRFRPKMENEVYGYLMCGDYQYKRYNEENTNAEVLKLKHTWFRIPCIGNTWLPCTEWTTEWDCPTEITLPPTVPARTTFGNFMLSNKLEIPMHFKFDAPHGTNFVIMPMCGIVQSRGWQIISVALEPKSFGHYYETWDLIINKVQKARICLCGNAEISQVEVMSPGYNPATHAMYEFPSTITGCTNYCTAFLHNLTRMEIHIRILNSVSWLGADDCGSVVLPPKEIVKYHWWFFPKTPNKVYDTTITCSCICLIDGRPVGEPTEIFIHIYGFSELPDLRVLPRTTNLHDIVVGDNLTFSITLYNYGSCYFTSRLYHLIDGMGDDFSGDRLEINSTINSLKPSNHCEVKLTVTPDGAGPRRIKIKYAVPYRTEYGEVEEIQPIRKTICTIWYDGIYPTLKVKRTISVKCPVILSNHCVWNITNVEELNKALEDCRPNKPLDVNIFAPDLCVWSEYVELIFVMGCVYTVPVPWSLRREKICDCEMVEVQVGISTYEMRHTCIHRPLIELSPANGIVSPDNPGLLYLRFNYISEGQNTLCYVMTMPNDRTLNIYLNIYAHLNTKGILTPLRRPVYEYEYLTILDCGRVPINNLDSVIRIAWLYNPTEVFTTWRLLRGNTISPDSVIRCLLYFAEVPPLGKLAIPFAFMPTEMIDYEKYKERVERLARKMTSTEKLIDLVRERRFLYDLRKRIAQYFLILHQPITFPLLGLGSSLVVERVWAIIHHAGPVQLGGYHMSSNFVVLGHAGFLTMFSFTVIKMTFFCSFGYDTVKMLVKGQGGLPNCVETRLDIPSYVEKIIRSAYRREVVYLSMEHITIPIMATHSLTREIIAICNDTDHVMRFIWLPERIANIVNIVMTPCWGVVQPKSSEWITMTVYTLQEPATFTTTVACEILDLTERKRYQQNEMLKRNKIEKCNQEFVITEQGFYHPCINDSPPYVLDIRKPQPFYLAMTVSISSKGQRDGYPRMLLKQMWQQTPPYDLLSSDMVDYGALEKNPVGNNMMMVDIIRIIDGILWDALHSKIFKHQIQFYSREEIPTYEKLVKVLQNDKRPKLSRRVTSGICDAIVNKAVFHVYDLNPKHEVSIMDAE